jgi:hypothetical protein
VSAQEHRKLAAIMFTDDPRFETVQGVSFPKSEVKDPFSTFKQRTGSAAENVKRVSNEGSVTCKTAEI